MATAMIDIAGLTNADVPDVAAKVKALLQAQFPGVTVTLADEELDEDVDALENDEDGGTVIGFVPPDDGPPADPEIRQAPPNV
jgi:hypothetical protein